MSLRHSLKWAFVQNWGRRVASTAVAFVIAVILGPHDFGLVAMALVAVNLLEVFLEQGVTTAVIQRERLEPDHRYAAFWLSVGWGTLIVIVAIVASDWWARLNGQPEVGVLIDVLALTILFQSVSVVAQAVLERATRFRVLAGVWNVAVIAGGAVGVGLAIAGAGVWAIVGQQLTTEGLAMVLIWAASDWRPRLRFSLRHARELLGFSLNVFFANLGGFVNRRADVLLMGLFFSPAVVGLYRLADRVVDTVLEMTTRPIAVISLPHFSRLQSDPVRLRRTVLAALRATMVAAVPALLVVAACGDLIVRVLGPEWTLAGDALELLAIVGIGKAVVFFTGPLLFAVARPRLRATLLWALALASAATVVGVGLLLEDGEPSDQLVGMSGSRAALFVIAFVPINALVIARMAGLSLSDLLDTAKAPLAGGLAGLAAVVSIRASGVLDSFSPVSALIVTGTIGAITAAVVVLALEPLARSELAGVSRRLRGSYDSARSFSASSMRS
jgi:teichuronic acid exporter